MEPIYKRVVLKLSGEAMAGEKGTGIDQETISSIADQVKKLQSMGVEIAIVVGGGNFGEADLQKRWTGPLLITWVC